MPRKLLSLLICAGVLPSQLFAKVQRDFRLPSEYDQAGSSAFGLLGIGATDADGLTVDPDQSSGPRLERRVYGGGLLSLAGPRPQLLPGGCG